MQRLTRFLLLATFLHLQVACCCAAHSVVKPSSGVEPNDVATCHSVCGSSSHTHDHPCNSGHEHDDHGSSDSHQEHCHLCVLTHLQFVAGPHSITINFDAATFITGRLDEYLAPSQDGSIFVVSHTPSDGERLLACGAMLRI